MTSTLVWTTETPPPTPHEGPVDDRPFVLCRVCYYHKPLGEPCGLPCL